MPPDQAPVTFSVTSVRSIQSPRAQPAAATIKIAHTSLVIHFIASTLRRIRLGSRSLTTKRCLPRAKRSKDPTRQFVPVNRQLPTVGPARILETEDIAGHAPLDIHTGGRGGAAGRHLQHSGDLRSPLLQLELDLGAGGRSFRRSRPETRDVLGH